MGEFVAIGYHKALVPLYKTLRCHISQVRNYRSFELDVTEKHKTEKYL